MDRLSFFNLVKKRDSETLDNMSKATAYYMKVYDGKRSFNWAAALLGVWWFCYRRMYLLGILGVPAVSFLATIVFIVLLVLAAQLSNIFDVKPDENPIIHIASILFFAGIIIIQGYLGNVLYKKHLAKKLKKGIVRSGASLKAFFLALITQFLLILLIIILLGIVCSFIPK